MLVLLLILEAVVVLMSMLVLKLMSVLVLVVAKKEQTDARLGKGCLYEVVQTGQLPFQSITPL